MNITDAVSQLCFHPTNNNLLLVSLFEFGFKLIDTSSSQLAVCSQFENKYLNYGVDINPVDSSVGIGSGG
jgi:hypothetical protein